MLVESFPARIVAFCRSLTDGSIGLEPAQIGQPDHLPAPGDEGQGAADVPPLPSEADQVHLLLSNDLPRFLSSFELFACDQLTGLSSPALRPVTPSESRPARADLRARLEALAGCKSTPCGALRLDVRRKALYSDVTMLLGFVLASAMMFKFAASGARIGPRNPAADAIAERFASTADEDDISLMERRLDFAPRMQWSTPVEARETRVESSVPLAGAFPRLPLEALGAVILSDLPAGTELSRGLKVSPTAWALAQGDLDNLEVTLPQNVGPEVATRVAIVDGSGCACTTFTVTVKGLAAVAEHFERSFGEGLTRTAVSNIQTGAVEPAASQRSAAPVVSVAPPARRVKAAVRRNRHRPQHARTPARAVVRVTLPKSPVPQQPAPAVNFPVLSIFKPAAESAATKPGEGVAPSVAPTPSQTKPGVFPRSPMEEEAGRR